MSYKPMSAKRLARLRELSAKKNLSDEEDSELGNLVGDRHVDIMMMIPLPMCCEAARKWPAVTFSVDSGGDAGDSHTDPGRWWVSQHRELDLTLSSVTRHRYAPADAFPPPKFCPYCGTPLPEMRRKDPMPPTVCRVTDGGYYCDTCHERLNCCLCDPPSSAFEPVP